MIERNKTANILLDIGRKTENIRLMLMTGSRVNPLASRDRYEDYDIIYGAKDPKALLEDPSFLEDLDPIFIYSENYKPYNKAKESVNFKVLTSWQTKVDIEIIPLEDLDRVLTNNTLLSLVMDKDNLIKKLPLASDISYRVMRPTKNEFEMAVYEFFAGVLDLLPYLYRKSYIGSIQEKRKLEDGINKMLAWDLAYKGDFKVNFGKNYKDLENYMDDGQLEALYKTMDYRDIDTMWEALFTSMSFFRSLGLGLGQRLNYAYPKKMDVAITSYVREVMNDAKNT